MKVVSVNVGLPRPAMWHGMLVKTGIFKEPVLGPVPIRKLNLSGDAQADLTVHGGRDKAVYGYPSEHYTYWRTQLPEVPLGWGHFGENLTTGGIDERTTCIGDQLRVGSAVIMVTQPRMPCYKLNLRFNRDDMTKRFLASQRSGFYFSVLEEGEAEAGSKIEFVHRDPGKLTVLDILDLYLGRAKDAALLERAMNLPALPENWKTDLLARPSASGI